MGFLAASWTLPIQRADVIGQHVKYWKCLSLDGTWYCQSIQRLSLYLREAHQGNSTHLTQTFDIGKSNDFIAVTLISCCWVSSSHGCGPSKIPTSFFIYLYLYIYTVYLYCIYCIQVCGLRCSRGVSEGRSNTGPTPWSAYIKQPSTHGVTNKNLNPWLTRTNAPWTSCVRWSLSSWDGDSNPYQIWHQTAASSES